MIERLTQQQEDMLPVVAKEWRDIGLCTLPADRKAAEDAIVLMYQCGGLKEPQRIEWFGSPIAMVRDCVGGGTPVHSAISNCVYGQHDAGWLAFYAFFRDVVGLIKETEPLSGLMALARSAGWAMPYENVCYVSERQCAIMLDDRDRVHNPNGAAIEFPDGEKVYAWRGVPVPSEWILQRDKFDASKILNWPNIEQRTCAVEIFGWGAVLGKSNVKVIHKAREPRIGTLFELDLPGAGKQRFLRARCGTGKVVVMPVPEVTRTAWEAQAWMFQTTVAAIKRSKIRT